MADLIHVDRLGDINFGLPSDIAPHKKPWAYYDVLGVSKTASLEEIKKAAKRLSFENHPDRFASQGVETVERANQRQRLVNDIADVLTDDGGELGEEWGKRQIYDRVSGYGDFFGAAHIEHKGERTGTIVEDLLDVLELEKRKVKTKYEFEKENPVVAELIRKFHEAERNGLRYEVNRIGREVVAKSAEKEGLSVEEFVRKQREMSEQIEGMKREREQRNREFKKGLDVRLREAKAYPNPSNIENNPNSQRNKVFDIWYNGEKDKWCNVTFGVTGYPYYSLVGFKETDQRVIMGLEGSAILSGMRKVHFKAEYVHVTITDAHLEGIFQIVNGSITIEYEGSSYGTVIRARGPNVTASPDFVQQGDLYVPKTFAAEGWAEKAPAVDIAVMDGSVSLCMKQPEVQMRRSSEWSFDKKIISLDYIISTSFNDKKY